MVVDFRTRRAGLPAGSPLFLFNKVVHLLLAVYVWIPYARILNQMWAQEVIRP